MSRRSGRPPTSDRRHPGENLFKPSFPDEPRDETESSSYSSPNSNDSDYQVPEKRPKPAPRRPYVKAKKSKGRRLRRNLVKERKEREEPSTIEIETVTTNSAETSNSLRNIEPSSPSLELHKSAGTDTKIDSNYMAQCLEIDPNILDENLKLVRQEQLYADADEVLKRYIQKSEDKELLLNNAKKDQNKKPEKNMALLNTIKDELIRGVEDFHWSVDEPTSSHSAFAQSTTQRAHRSDSDSGRESTKFIDIFFKPIEMEQKPSSTSTTNAGKPEFATQDLSKSYMKNLPAQNQENIMDNRENLIDLTSLPCYDNIVGGDLRTIEATNHRRSTYQDQSVGNVQNCYSQNQEPTTVRRNMNDLVNAPIIVCSGAEDQEIRDLRVKINQLQILISSQSKILLEMTAAMKNLETRVTSLSQVVGSGENLRMGNVGAGLEQARTVSGLNTREQTYQFVHQPLLLSMSVTAGNDSDEEDSDIVPHQDVNARIFPRNVESVLTPEPEPDQQVSASLECMNLAPIAVPKKLQAAGSFRQKPPPKYEERHQRKTVSSAGNMKIEVLKSELESPNVVEPTSNRADINKQFSTALSAIMNIRNQIGNISFENNESQEPSTGTFMANIQQSCRSDMNEIADSPGRLMIVDDDYQSLAEYSGIDQNHASMEVDLPIIEQPGPSVINQIRKASEGWVIYDELESPSTSGSNRIQNMPSTITFAEPRVSNTEKINYWGDLSYFEDSKQVGRNFSCKGMHVRVDCFKNREFNKRNNGYHIGPFRNSDRSRETTGIRNKIDCGIMLYFIKGQLSVVNHSKCTVYVLSNISIGKREKISREKRQICIPPDHTVQVLRVPFDKKTSSIIDLKKTIEQFDESFYRIYISFEKSWTERGPNELPCWLALQLKSSGEE